MASDKANREDKATKARPTGRQIKPAMSNHPLLQFATQSQLKANRGADTFKVGDGVRVSTKVREGDKERTQVFSGIVISRKGGNVQETFTVRRVSFGEGVERTFPVHSPNIEKIEVERVSQVMKARLYYLRGRQGKSATKVKEKRYDPSAETAAK
jgi:large subunit ribosomal protein L19